MKLYYDVISKMYSLETEQGPEFLGPFAHTLLKLKQAGLTEDQSREAVLKAMFGYGRAICLDAVIADNLVGGLKAVHNHTYGKDKADE
ncbi:MAG: hypothetical protein WC444_04685 [Candidatus Paceibacterota bacterium]